MKQNMINFPVTLMGQWQSPKAGDLSHISASLKNWLLDEGSLTARLKAQCSDFSVKVIGEKKQLCSSDEACSFIKAGEEILVREVLLYCDNIPQVFARSLLPLTSLTGEGQALENLGTQPLGQVIFNNPSLQRQRLEVSSFDCSSSVAKLAQQLVDKASVDLDSPNELLWGRRSIFMLESKPLMVAEVFLPSAFAYQE